MSADHQHVYLVCYDIRWPAPHDEKRGQRRLHRIHRLLRGFGDALQDSVFRCTLSPRHRAELELRLKALIDPEVDQVLIVHLGAAGARTTWRATTLGVPMSEAARTCIVIG